MKTTLLMAGVVLGSLAVVAQTTDARTTYKQISDEFQRAYKNKDYPALIDANKKALEFTHGSSRWMLNLAGCFALAGRNDEAFLTLLRVADMKVDGSEIDRDQDFASLKTDPRWPGVLNRFRQNSEKIGYTNGFAKLPDPELLVEDISWSQQTGNLYMTSVRKKKVLRIVNKADVSTLIDLSSDPGWPLMAIVVDDKNDALWVTAAAMPDFELSPKTDWGRSALLEVGLTTGKIRHRFDLPDDGTPHVLGDAVLLQNGEIIISDGFGGAVYRFRKGEFTRIDHGEFISPQTPAVSPDGKIIIPDYVRGLALLAPDSPTPVSWIANSSQVLNGIDGLYFDPFSQNTQPLLLAIQNGINPHRVLAVHLDSKLRAVKTADVLLSNADGLGEPTHGVFVGDDAFYFIVNSGWDQLDAHGKPKSDVQPTPPEIGQVHLGRRGRPTLRRK